MPTAPAVILDALVPPYQDSLTAQLHTHYGSQAPVSQLTEAVSLTDAGWIQWLYERGFTEEIVTNLEDYTVPIFDEVLFATALSHELKRVEDLSSEAQIIPALLRCSHPINQAVFSIVLNAGQTANSIPALASIVRSATYALNTAV